MMRTIHIITPDGIDGEPWPPPDGFWAAAILLPEAPPYGVKFNVLAIGPLPPAPLAFMGGIFKED